MITPQLEYLLDIDPFTADPALHHYITVLITDLLINTLGAVVELFTHPLRPAQRPMAAAVTRSARVTMLLHLTLY